MDIQVSEDLSEILKVEWCTFLSTATHHHVRQDLRFGPVDLAGGQEVLYALGREGGKIRAVGLFTLLDHPFLPGAFASAVCLSGPISDDPELLVQFMEGVRIHKAFAKVGRISVTPYWLEDQGKELSDHLERHGWTLSEPKDSRMTGIVDISGDAFEIANRFSQTCRRKLRKAEKKNFNVAVLQGKTNAEDFLTRLNLHRSARGLRPLDQKTFMSAFEHIYRHNDLGVVLVIYHQGRFVAGIVLHRSRETTHFIHSVHDDAILAELGNLRISPLLMLDAMKWANEKGCRYFDLEGYGDPDDPNNRLKHIHKYKSEFKPKAVFRVAEHHKVSNRAIYVTGELQPILKRRIKRIFRMCNLV